MAAAGRKRGSEGKKESKRWRRSAGCCVRQGACTMEREKEDKIT